MENAAFILIIYCSEPKIMSSPTALFKKYRIWDSLPRSKHLKVLSYDNASRAGFL